MTANPNPADRTEPAIPQFTLGDRLRKAREFASLDQQHLASVIDIHRQTVARYENGVARPKRHVILSWSVATGVDLDWIAGPDADDQTVSSTVLASSGIQGPGNRGIPRTLARWIDGKDA